MNGIDLLAKNQVLFTHHVEQDEGGNLAHLIPALEHTDKFTAAVDAVGAGPLEKGLFSIEKDEPQRVVGWIVLLQYPGQLQQ